MDKSRRQFEETIKSLSDQSEFELKLKRANNGLNYADHHVDLMWISWQASRESLINSLEPVAWMWPVYHSENNQLTDDPVVSENIEMHLQSHGSPLKVTPLYRLDK
ncbi:hypothetical protein AB6G31_03860 [Providencia hangzhouensis]|uniref:hypothetical protein n=1 Tax=Providencia TaxID=586 RepID=UPI000ECB546F|nr:hypothetical protein [Providencia sp. PROV117]EJD6614119.1 hypothetical protein [Providencia rettgeri]ELL9151721.1 hypothetical protein [Providencia rettgeri]HCI96765.1 hypothetical protein [Providencia sp.]